MDTAPIILKGLFATIDSVIAFNETLRLPPIQNYAGEPLYITGYQVVGDTLTIAISNAGLPADSPPLQIVAKVNVAVTYKGPPTSTSDTTKAEITFDKNVPLVVTGTVTPSSSSTDKWDNSKLALTVAKWVAEKGQGVVYVIRHDGGPTGQLSWLVNADSKTLLNKTGTFIDEHTGGGVNGPFGLQTP